MPAAAAKRRICHRESFDTNGIIADVARVFAIALECGPPGRAAALPARRDQLAGRAQERGEARASSLEKGSSPPRRAALQSGPADG